MNGEMMKAIRIYYEMSQRDMAAKLGIVPSHLSMIEANKRRVTQALDMKLRQKLDITPECRAAVRRSCGVDRLDI